jgi:5'(3')-deoxyribonucleotidase
MDDTICNYSALYQHDLQFYPECQYPQSREGFFLELEPIANAINSVKHLQSLGHKIYFLTAPSYKNAHCYSEKRLWIEKFFGLEICKNLIIAENKSLVIGDYLIDDHTEGRGQNNFIGKLIHFGSEQFPNWIEITNFFNALECPTLNIIK